MGEYAKWKGEQIKIGTCEDMYYLRADQAKLVTAEKGSVDPIKDQDEIRFRFPWPDEDTTQPGSFENPFRAIGLHDVKPPPLGKLDHQNVQFKADVGYLLSVLCPEAEEGSGSDHNLTFHRNGFSGSVKVVQQRWAGSKLVTICQCGGCGAKYRLNTLEEAQPVINSLLTLAVHAARRDETSNAAFYTQIAERIEAGYKL